MCAVGAAVAMYSVVVQWCIVEACRSRGCKAPPADQLTLSQPGDVDYANRITAGTPSFSDLPTAL